MDWNEKYTDIPDYFGDEPDPFITPRVWAPSTATEAALSTATAW